MNQNENMVIVDSLMNVGRKSFSVENVPDEYISYQVCEKLPICILVPLIWFTDWTSFVNI